MAIPMIPHYGARVTLLGLSTTCLIACSSSPQTNIAPHPPNQAVTSAQPESVQALVRDVAAMGDKPQVRDLEGNLIDIRSVETQLFELIDFSATVIFAPADLTGLWLVQAEDRLKLVFVGAAAVALESVAVGDIVSISGIALSPTLVLASQVSTGPEIRVSADDIELLDDQAEALNLGTTSVGSPSDQLITIENTGTSDLVITNLNLPEGYTLTLLAGVALPDLVSIPPGSSESLLLTLTAAQAGQFAGEITFNTNDFDEDPFNLPITGQVIADATVVNTAADSSIPDDGLCSLREALAITDTSSCGGLLPMILFASELAGQTVFVSSTLTIDRDVEIHGLGSSAIEINGGGTVRVFSISPERTVNIEGITIANGSASLGGGIQNQGQLVISRSTLTNNTASDSGGAISNRVSANLVINNSTLAGNSGFGGGAIANGATSTLSINQSLLTNNGASNIGGGISNEGTLIVSSSTLSGNSAFGGGAIGSTSDLTLIGSTLTQNSAFSGGAMINQYGTATISNSTISSNFALAVGGGLTNIGRLTLGNTSFVSNSAADGGSLFNAQFFGVATINNTLFVNAQTSNCAENVDSITATNLSDDESCGGALVDPDTSGALGNLAANGTSVVVGDPQGQFSVLQTHALLSSSAAIDGGDTRLIPADIADDDADGDSTEPLPFDQRGSSFARVNGSSVDIGAFEF